jgi:hypothetical protein
MSQNGHDSIPVTFLAVSLRYFPFLCGGAHGTRAADRRSALRGIGAAVSSSRQEGGGGRQSKARNAGIDRLRMGSPIGLRNFASAATGTNTGTSPSAPSTSRLWLRKALHCMQATCDISRLLIYRDNAISAQLAIRAMRCHTLPNSPLLHAVWIAGIPFLVAL